MSYEIDDPMSSFKFSDRLAQENMWTKEYSLRVMEEYKKFMYLAAKYGNVTPSIQVDECWHLHMIYTRDYAEMCKSLGGFIHHGPTRGGKQEDNKYMIQYAQTLQWYEDVFGYEVPLDIWPPVFNRFEPDKRVKIDLATHWVIPVGDWKALLRVFKYYITSKIRL